MGDMKTQKRVRVRFAPSPTGHPHIGLVQPALFNWLFARHEGGTFVLRIEDTDAERSTPEYEREILDALEWLGIEWDEGPSYADSRGSGTQINADRIGENPRHHRRKSADKGEYGPYRQSERRDRYRAYLEQLLRERKAYWCYCTKEELDAAREAMSAQGLPPVYNGHCRALSSPPSGKSPQTIRFRVPEAKVEFKDLIRGSVTFDGRLFGDIVIAKNLDTPLYNFTVVADDHDMEITHVLRGEDHISNTPKQIFLQKALGFETPAYAHFPLILAPDRSKLSKRYTDTTLLMYRDEGYLPEAIVNFTALLGWHPSGDREIFSREELIKEFTLARVQKSGAVFNEEKLDWLNGEYIKTLPSEALAERIEPFLRERGITAERKFILRVAAVLRDRARTLKEFVSLGSFFFEVPAYEKALLVWKKDSEERTKDVLQKAIEILKGVEGDLDAGTFLALFEPLTAVYGKGTVLWPLRVALSGQAASPDPAAIAAVVGKKECLRRLEAALQKLE